MRVHTRQNRSFASSLTEDRLKRSYLGKLKKLLDTKAIAAELEGAGKDYEVIPLFMALLLQYVYKAADMHMAETLRDRLSWMGFCGFDPHGVTPSAATLCRFRNRLKKTGKFDRLLKMVKEQLASRGLELRRGSYDIADGVVWKRSVRPQPAKGKSGLSSRAKPGRPAGKPKGRR